MAPFGIAPKTSLGGCPDKAAASASTNTALKSIMCHYALKLGFVTRDFAKARRSSTILMKLEQPEIEIHAFRFRV